MYYGIPTKLFYAVLRQFLWHHHWRRLVKNIGGQTKVLGDKE